MTFVDNAADVSSDAAAAAAAAAADDYDDDDADVDWCRESCLIVKYDLIDK